jgi:hypothetical protein
MALESRLMTLDELGQYLRDISTNKINSNPPLNNAISYRSQYMSLDE